MAEDGNVDAAMAGSDIAAAPVAMSEEAFLLIKRRRYMATAACSTNSFNANDNPAKLEARKAAFIARDLRTGIAFSGGGIRSATISLGLTEALAAKGRFYPFDLMSTVSGGGYFGSFLRSLFVPRMEARGASENRAIVSDENRLAFADAVITSLPNEQYFHSGTPHGHFLNHGPDNKPQTIKNPLWWLRENGRYLAPNGMTDYVFALAFFVRNWLTLMIAILVAMIAAFALIQLIMYGIFLIDPHLAPFGAAAEAAFNAKAAAQVRPEIQTVIIPWSPLLALLPFLFLIAAGIALGYWFTLGMRHNLDSRKTTGKDEDPDKVQHRRDTGRLSACWAICAAIIALLIIVDLRGDKLALTLQHSVSIILMSAIVSSSFSAMWQREAINDASGNPKAPLRPGLLAWSAWLMAAFLTLLMILDLLGWKADGLIGALVVGATVLFMTLLLNAALYFQGKAQTSLANHMRRIQTRQLSNWLQWVVAAVAAIGLIDSLGLFVRVLSNVEGQLYFAKTAVTSSALLSVIAALVAKLPDWLGESKLSIASFARKNANVAALIAAILMLTALAVLADVFVLKTFWKGVAWDEQARIDRAAFGLLCLVATILVLIIGSAKQFLNQSALAPIYTSRLGRTYLGGSNLYRLASNTPSDVTRSMIGDDLPIHHYMKEEVAAPLHLINVTLNRTVGSANAGKRAGKEAKDDPLIPTPTSCEAGAAPMAEHGRVPSYESQLTLRDRKGDRVVISHFGLRAGAEFFDWKAIEKVDDEGLMLSRMCAISGAAVSSGMGRNTSLGTAMALTLSNVRLGHWWRAPERDLETIKQPKSLRRHLSDTCQKWLHSYVYLVAEMLARFDREQPYWYLSDGGHSENSGALSLLERGCQLILVADNGQDPDYSFSDLETFIRAARTDIGKEVRPATKSELAAIISASARHCFLNCSEEAWSTQLRSEDNQAFALLLHAHDMDRIENGVLVKPDAPTCWIVWLKPNLFKGLPSDIAGYGISNADFPQQSTANQFFDEAQWESYRRLGFSMGSQLFDDPETLARELPPIFQALRK